MGGKLAAGLSRRERQIMDLIYSRGRATVLEVRKAMADPPSYSAVRALLGILEKKRAIYHEAVDGKYVYIPVKRRSHAAKGALRGLLRTFFDNSAAKAVAALLDVSDAELSEAEINEISDLIANARKRGPKR